MTDAIVPTPSHPDNAEPAARAQHAANDDEIVDGEAVGQDGKDKISIYREEDEARVSGTRKWILSGTMLDDLVIERKIFSPGERMIEKQLHSSSLAWEKQQREKLLRTGSRSSQMWEAYE